LRLYMGSRVRSISVSPRVVLHVSEITPLERLNVMASVITVVLAKEQADAILNGAGENRTGWRGNHGPLPGPARHRHRRRVVD
jgi:hypothetical protein